MKIRNVSFGFAKSSHHPFMEAALEQAGVGGYLQSADSFIMLYFTLPLVFDKELLSLKKFAEEDDFKVVLISFSPQSAELDYFLQEKKICFPIIYDPAGNLGGFKFFFSGLAPSYAFLMTPDGRDIYVREEEYASLPVIRGCRDWDGGYGKELLDGVTGLWEEEWRKKTKLVDLSEYGFAVSKRYYHYGWTDDPKCRARLVVADALLQARRQLQKSHFFKDYNFLVWDAYRDFFTHRRMRESFFRRIREINPDASADEIWAEVGTFASRPVRICRQRGNHRSGSSLDVTLVDGAGREIYMGTDHDDLTKKAAPFYFGELEFRSSEESHIHGYRMLLRETMARAGFESHQKEWWHFDYSCIIE